MAVVPFAEGISAEFKLRLFLVVPLFFCAIRFALVPPNLARHDKTPLKLWADYHYEMEHDEKLSLQ